MRYHGSLISNMLGVPTLNLYYDIHRHYKNKIEYLYKFYGYKNYKINFSKADSKSFITAFNELVNSPKEENLNKKVYMDANKQLDEVINEYILNKK